MRADALTDKETYKDGVVIILASFVFFEEVKYTKEYYEHWEEEQMKENKLKMDQHRDKTTAEFVAFSPSL
jgi:hypothetical protein